MSRMPVSSAVQQGPPLTRAAGVITGRRWVHLRDVLRALIGRDMKLRYRGSVAGLGWTLLNPLSELLVLLFVFGVILPLGIPNYGAFLFTGLLAYAWFSTSLGFSAGAVVGSRELVKAPGIPSTILPVVTVASTLVHFLMSLPILFALVLFSGVPVTAHVLFLPVLIAIQFILILSLAYPLAIVNVWFRDTQYFLRIALQLLFYCTPIFYEVKSVPERYWFLYRLNPMVAVVEGYRDVLLRGTLPPLGPLVRLMIVCGILLLVGVTLFRRTNHRFAEEL